MRRASRFSLFLLSRCLSTTTITTTTPIRPISSTTLHPPTTTARPLPRRCFSSNPNDPLPPDPEEAFEAARTTEDILSAFRSLERHLPSDDVRLGLACLKVGQHLDSISHSDRDAALSFARRALSILDSPAAAPIALAMSLHLVASVSYGLGHFRDSLGYLNRAARILNTISSHNDHNTDEEDAEFDEKPVRHAVELLLANTKTALGRREDAIVNLRNCLELKEEMFDPSSREVGVAYRNLAEAYVAVLNFGEALPLCRRALEIHEVLLGKNSVEAANDRRLLAVVYSGLEQHQKALEQNQLSQKVMKRWGMDSDIVNAEIEAANMQIAMGRYDGAVATLKGIVEVADKDSHTRALVFITMAKALGAQEKHGDAKRCLEIACGILEKLERNHPQEAAEGYADIAEAYENLNDFETAISLLKRAVALFEKLSQGQYAEADVSARIGWLLLLTGKVKEGIPYLESAAETLKESFGSKHYAIGYIYNNLGAAYMELGRPQSAAQMFSLAKDVMDVALGKHHSDSVGACQNLANAYEAVGNFDLALEFQKQVVDAWGKHGPDGSQHIQGAKNRLEEIEKKITKQVLDAWEGEVTKLKKRHIEGGARDAMSQATNNHSQTR